MLASQLRALWRLEQKKRSFLVFFCPQKSHMLSDFLVSRSVSVSYLIRACVILWSPLSSFGRLCRVWLLCTYMHMSVIVHATFACLRTISCRRYVELSVGSAASAVGRYVSEAISGCELSSRLSRSQTIDRWWRLASFPVAQWRAIQRGKFDKRFILHSDRTNGWYGPLNQTLFDCQVLLHCRQVSDKYNCHKNPLDDESLWLLSLAGGGLQVRVVFAVLIQPAAKPSGDAGFYLLTFLIQSEATVRSYICHHQLLWSLCSFI